MENLIIGNLSMSSESQSWALEVFFIFFNNKKGFFFIFYQVNLTGSGFFIKTGAEVGYYD